MGIAGISKPNFNSNVGMFIKIMIARSYLDLESSCIEFQMNDLKTLTA